MNQKFKQDSDPKADSITHLTFHKSLFTQREWNLAKHEYTWGDTSREQIITRSHWQRMRAEQELWNRGEEDYWTGKVIEESWRWVLTEGSFAGHNLRRFGEGTCGSVQSRAWTLKTVESLPEKWKVFQILQRGLVKARWAGGHARKQGYGFWEQFAGEESKQDQRWKKNGNRGSIWETATRSWSA